MGKINLFFSGLFTLLCATAAAQRLIENTKQNYSVSFYLTPYNNIVIKALINDRDTVNLMLHTAAEDITLTEDALVKLKTIKFNGTVDSVKSWGGGSNSSDFSKKNTLRMGDMNWDSITIWKDKNSGQQTDGKFGLNLFENKILELDFDKNLLAVETKMPRRIKKYHRFQLLIKNDGMFIKAVCQTGKDSFVNYFLIHSGYAGDILLDDRFVSDNKIEQQINITGEKKLQDAYGNVLVTKKGILPLLKIGRLQLADIPVGFFEGAIGRQKISMVGADILKRFNWVIDAKREYIYLKPNLLFKTNFINI